MKALIYQSFTLVDFSNATLLELEITSIKNNKELNITGLLSYYDSIFYQYLEGDDRLDLLMHKIENDNRHSIKKILYFTQIDERIFSDWYMKIYDHYKKKLNEDLLIRNLFSFVKDKKADNKFIQSYFIQNLMSIKNKM